LKALLSFFTVLPVRRASLQEAAREVRLLPLVGLVTGLPGAVLLLTAHMVPPGVAATLALGAVLLAAGLHHADGVLDVGDALMAHGGPGRRREVLRDTRVGIGGLGALFLVYAPTVAALAALCATSPGRAALALFAGEVSARSAMLLVLVFGEPADLRSSTLPFVRALSGPHRTPAVIVALLAPLPFLLAMSALLAPLVVLALPLVGLGALRISAVKFGGIGGDVVGATGEVCRAVVLIALSAMI
jgi:adenosylcobinamide-GDP ribazoletransferase